MGDKTYSRDFFVDVGRDGGHYVTELIQSDIDTKGGKFIAQHLQEVPFADGRRLAL